MTQKIAGDTPSYSESVQQGTTVISDLLKIWTESESEELSDQKMKMIAVAEKMTSTRLKIFY